MDDEITTNEESVLKHTVKEITQPFKDLVKASRVLWGVNISYLLEGLVYFGMLGLLAIYFNRYAGLNDIQADQGGVFIGNRLLFQPGPRHGNPP